MKPLKTKAQIRAEIEQQVNEFVQQGGAVHDIPSGISGYTTNQNPFAHMVMSGPPQQRTPLVEIIKQIDARKSPRQNPLKTTKRRPRRKLITDDFGEPVRWVWVEE